MAADATDADRLSELAADAVALYNCASPPYHRWPTEWPPLGAATLKAAERSGAVLAAASNLYGYGPVDGPITGDTPLATDYSSPKLRIRGELWRDVQSAHEAGRVRATEVRSSDYADAVDGRTGQRHGAGAACHLLPVVQAVRGGLHADRTHVRARPDRLRPALGAVRSSA